MTVKLTCQIAFRGNAREAMEFYKDVFGGELFMDTFGEFMPPEMPVDETEKDNIMHAYLKTGSGIELMAGDVPASMPYEEGARVTLTLNGDDEPALRGYWDRLAKDGKVTMPLEKAPWGDTFGILTDKFGVGWVVDIGTVQ